MGVGEVVLDGFEPSQVLVSFVVAVPPLGCELLKNGC